MSGHVDGRLVPDRVFDLPECGRRLILRVKVDPAAQHNKPSDQYRPTTTSSTLQSQHSPSSIERHVAQETVLVPAPREHRERDRDRDVDPNLAHLDLALIPPRRRAGPREDRRAVPVAVGVDDRQRVVERVRLEHEEHGPEDLLAVAPHRRRRFDDRRADPVAGWVVGHGEPPPVERDDPAFFFSGRDQACDALLRRGRDDGAPVTSGVVVMVDWVTSESSRRVHALELDVQICAFLEPLVNIELLDALAEVGEPRLCNAD